MREDGSEIRRGVERLLHSAPGRIFENQRLRRIEMKKYLRRTWKNKAAALAIGFVGYLSTFIDGDATACVFLMLIAVPLFFTRRKYIY
jgi:hypothetical protein